MSAFLWRKRDASQGDTWRAAASAYSASFGAWLADLVARAETKDVTFAVAGDQATATLRFEGREFVITHKHKDGADLVSAVTASASATTELASGPYSAFVLADIRRAVEAAANDDK